MVFWCLCECTLYLSFLIWLAMLPCPICLLVLALACRGSPHWLEFSLSNSLVAFLAWCIRLACPSWFEYLSLNFQFGSTMPNFCPTQNVLAPFPLMPSRRYCSPNPFLFWFCFCFLFCFGPVFGFLWLSHVLHFAL